MIYTKREPQNGHATIIPFVVIDITERINYLTRTWILFPLSNLHLISIGVVFHFLKVTFGPFQAFLVLERARYRNSGQS